MKIFSKSGKIFLLGAIVLSLAFPLASLAIVKKGDPVPAVKVVSTSGQNIALADYKGSVVVIDFFASWCPPCRDSIPHLIELDRKYGKQGLKIIGFSADEDEKVVKPFLLERKIVYPVAMANEQLLTQFGLRSIPTLFVVDKKGIIADKVMGYNDSIGKSMEKLIQKLLAQ